MHLPRSFFRYSYVCASFTFPCIPLILFGCATSKINPEVHAQMKEMPSDFVYLSDVDPSIVQDIRYYGPYNFMGRRVTGYQAPRCILTRKAAEALKAAQAALKERFLSLKVYDCYRPQMAVDDFVAWGKDLKETKMKKEFYPQVDKSNLFRDGYIAEKSCHSHGSTVDVTLVAMPPAKQADYLEGQRQVECTRPVGQRFKDNSLDMGTGYDCFDPRSHTENPAIGEEQRKNRALLKSTMEEHGFKNITEEWWHYTLVNDPYPESYFNFEVSEIASCDFASRS